TGVQTCALPIFPVLAGLAFEMQIDRVEFGDIGERLHVGYLDDAAAPSDEVQRAQLLQRAIGMHNRESEQVGQIGLAHREFELVAIRTTDDPAPSVEFAKQVGEMAGGVAATDAEQP